MVRILAVILLAGCAQGPPQPVEIEGGDSCALCKMAISEKRYSAELIDEEEHVFKFDDIGCMARFGRDRRLVGTAIHIFVRDYAGGGWLRGDGAHYVQSAEIPSPMASGLIALPELPTAEQYATRFHGRILGFSEIWAR